MEPIPPEDSLKAPLDSAAARSIAAEGAAMHRGRGKMLLGVGVALVAALGGFAALTAGGDEQRVYRDMGKAVNGLKAAHFDQFWACAFRGYDIRRLKSNADLWAQLDLRAGRGGRRYAVWLRDQCLGKLETMQPRLDALIPPEDLVGDIDRMNRAIGELRSATSALVAYLDRDELQYASEAAKNHADKLARGWYDFRKVHAEFNKTLKSKLEPR